MQVSAFREFLATHIEATQNVAPLILNASDGQDARTLTGDRAPAMFHPPLIAREHNAAIGHLQAFLDSRKRIRAGVNELKCTLSTLKDRIIETEKECETRRKQLDEEELLLRQIEKELVSPEPTDNTDHEVRNWLEWCPKGVGFEQRFISILISHAMSTLDDMAEEIGSLFERREGLKASCQSHREQIHELTAKIQSELEHREALGIDLDGRMSHLAQRNKMCAEVATEGGYT